MADSQEKNKLTETIPEKAQTQLEKDFMSTALHMLSEIKETRGTKGNQKTNL